MFQYSKSIEIAATPAEIWPLMADVVAWPRWLPTVSRVEPLGGAPSTVEVGQRYRVEQPRLRPAILLVTVVEPPTRFVWESSSPGLKFVADHRLEALDARRTRATLSVQFKGWLSGLVRWLYRSLIVEYVDREAEALRRESLARVATGVEQREDMDRRSDPRQ